MDAMYGNMDHILNFMICIVFLISYIFMHMKMDFQLQEIFSEMCQAQFFFNFHQIHEPLFQVFLEVILKFPKEYELFILLVLKLFCVLDKILINQHMQLASIDEYNHLYNNTGFYSLKLLFQSIFLFSKIFIKQKELFQQELLH